MDSNDCCPVCFNTYNSRIFIPFVGHCGHSVCGRCVSKIKTKCPLCVEYSFEKPRQNYLAVDLLTVLDRKEDEITQQNRGINEIFSNIPKVQQSTSAVCFSNQQRPPTPPFTPFKPAPQPISPQCVSPIPLAPSKSIFVRNIGNLTLEEVKKYFDEFGTIVRYGFGNKEGVNKGFALIDYYSESQATKAIAAMDGFPVGPNFQKISVSYKTTGKGINPAALNAVAADRARFSNKSTAVVVKNLSDVTEEQLRRVFERDGPVEMVHMVRDRLTNRFSGTAFVYFTSEEPIERALERDCTCIPGVPGKMTVERCSAKY